MLSEGRDLRPGHPNLGGHLRFLNLSTGALVRLHLPLFDDHILLDSTEGILLLRRNHDTAIRLLHPFTGDIADLPPLSSLLLQVEPHIRHLYTTQDYRISERMAEYCLHYLFNHPSSCAAITVGPAGAITVMLNLPLNLGKTLIHVSHATAGDQQWTLSGWKLQPLVAWTASFQGKLYAVAAAAGNSSIYQIDPSQSTVDDGSHSPSPLPPPRMIAECPLLVGEIGAANLVGCGSGLMLVGFNDPSFAHLVVYRLSELTRGRIVPVTNIGDHALFLGERGVCVSPGKWLPSVSTNSITRRRTATLRLKRGQRRQRQPYFRVNGTTFQQYHLGSGTWSTAIDDDILGSDRGPASPYMLDRHIFTCCCRSLWNKGLMMVSPVKHDLSELRNLLLKQGS